MSKTSKAHNFYLSRLVICIMKEVYKLSKSKTYTTYLISIGELKAILRYESILFSNIHRPNQKAIVQLLK